MQCLLALLAKTADLLEDVHELEPHDVARKLSAVLGRALVAVAMGVTETKLVAKWEKGEKNPRGDRDGAMRVALQLTMLLSPRYSARAIQSWFMGVNQHLGDLSPTETLAALARERNNDAVRKLMNAARAFVNR
jgi:hypothetical protein